MQEDTRLHIEYVMRRLQRAATTLYRTKEYVSRRQKNALMKILCLMNILLCLVPVCAVCWFRPEENCNCFCVLCERGICLNTYALLKFQKNCFRTIQFKILKWCVKALKGFERLCWNLKEAYNTARNSYGLSYSSYGSYVFWSENNHTITKTSQSTNLKTGKWSIH